MIHFFVGENSFEIERELKKLQKGFDGEVQKIDADSLSIGDLQNVLQGRTLFSDKRLVIIKQLSENKVVWEVLPERLETISSDVTLVLIEPKPDKRTKTYKELIKIAEVAQFQSWTPRDTSIAVEWTVDEAKRHNFELTHKLAKHLVERVGLDQWRLYHALEKLSLAGELSTARIDEVIETQPDENVFELLATALRADTRGVQDMLQALRRTTDAYQTFGLLTSQLIQLSALAVSDKTPDVVAKDIGAHPFALSKLVPFAKRLTDSDVKHFLKYAAQTDVEMKSSGIDPWVNIETLLLKIARQ